MTTIKNIKLRTLEFKVKYSLRIGHMFLFPKYSSFFLEPKIISIYASSFLLPVMVNLMCQLRGYFWMKFTFELVNFEYSRLPSIMCVGREGGSSNQLQVWIEWDQLPWAGENSPGGCLSLDLHHGLSWASSVCPYNRNCTVGPTGSESSSPHGELWICQPP